MDPGFQDNNANPRIPTSSGNYFSGQAMRAGLMANGINRNELMMNPDPMRDMIQRELEKDRIREEIIAAEMFRRRELEAEVRRELAIERELAMEHELALRRADGYSMITTSPAIWSEPRLPMLDRPHGPARADFRPYEGFPLQRNPGVILTETIPCPARNEVGPVERLPFQRNPEAARMIGCSNGQAKKVILVAKPPTTSDHSGSKDKPTNSNHSGSKGKPTSDHSASKAKPTTSDHSGSKKKPEVIEKVKEINAVTTPTTKQPSQVWACALCKVTATSEQTLNMHLEGKKHKRKLNAAKLIEERAKNTVTIKNNNSEKKTTSTSVAKTEEESLVSTESKKRKYRYYCKDCHVKCHSEEVLQSHCNGKRHKGRMVELKKLSEVNKGSTLSASSSTKRGGTVKKDVSEETIIGGKESLGDVCEEMKSGEKENYDGKVEGKSEEAIVEKKDASEEVKAVGREQKGVQLRTYKRKLVMEIVDKAEARDEAAIVEKKDATEEMKSVGKEDDEEEEEEEEEEAKPVEEVEAIEAAIDEKKDASKEMKSGGKEDDEEAAVMEGVEATEEEAIVEKKDAPEEMKSVGKEKGEEEAIDGKKDAFEEMKSGGNENEEEKAAKPEEEEEPVMEEVEAVVVEEAEAMEE